MVKATLIVRRTGTLTRVVIDRGSGLFSREIRTLMGLCEETRFCLGRKFLRDVIYRFRQGGIRVVVRTRAGKRVARVLGLSGPRFSKGGFICASPCTIRRRRLLL